MLLGDPYEDPQIALDRTKKYAEYTKARREWRRTQPDHVIRELASDFRSGIIDESTQDAMLEYYRRWPNAPIPSRVIPDLQGLVANDESSTMEELSRLYNRLIE